LDGRVVKVCSLGAFFSDQRTKMESFGWVHRSNEGQKWKRKYDREWSCLRESFEPRKSWLDFMEEFLKVVERILIKIETTIRIYFSSLDRRRGRTEPCIVAMECKEIALRRYFGRCEKFSLS
jgi:hypothetical protein